MKDVVLNNVFSFFYGGRFYPLYCIILIFSRVICTGMGSYIFFPKFYFFLNIVLDIKFDTYV